MDFRSLAGTPNARGIASLAVLDDPVRASVYAYVAGATEPVSRDQTAADLGVTRRIAAFHLDRLATAGWLEVSFRRLSGRTGPGAGRSSKLYRRSDHHVQVSIPARNYELLARLMTQGLRRRPEARRVEDLQAAARDFGMRLGTEIRGEANPAATQGAITETLHAELARQGFEPAREGSAIKLRNCPFHEVASANKDLICRSNLALMEGYTAGLDLSTLTPVFEQEPGLCCVAFRPRGDSAGASQQL